MTETAPTPSEYIVAIMTVAFRGLDGKMHDGHQGSLVPRSIASVDVINRLSEEGSIRPLNPGESATPHGEPARIQTSRPSRSLSGISDGAFYELPRCTACHPRGSFSHRERGDGQPFTVGW